MRLNLRLTALLFGILVIALIGRGVLRGMGSTRLRSGNNKNAGGGVAVMLASGLALMLVGYVGYFFGRLIQAAVSRQREYLADASAVQFTRNPDGMVGALSKIGGYALGSSITAQHAVEIRHFFFAQGFRSSFNGLFATHPPLVERIRAVDPSFDGKFFVPETVVDVRRESFQTAGFTRHPGPGAAAAAFAAVPNVPPSLPPPVRLTFAPAAVVGTIGNPSPAHVEAARAILGRLPPGLHAAALDPAQAPALVLGLVLSADPAIRARQVEAVTSGTGAGTARILLDLDRDLHQLGGDGRLPLLQLALPAIAQHDPAALDRLVTTLDELVHTDQRVSVFEYALQKVLIRHLALHRRPAGPAVDLHRLAAAAEPVAAFAAGIGGLGGSLGRLPLRAAQDCSLDRLDEALERLTRASGAIKRDLLTAAARVVTADGQVTVEETELLRAIAAVLDCPLPPVL
jgi:hypothetical protein